MNTYRDTSLDLWVQELNGAFLRRWWECSSAAPEFGPTYTLRQQATNEKQLDRALNAIMRELQKTPASAGMDQAARERIQNTLTGFARTSLGLEDHHLATIQDYRFLEVAVEFAQQARRFDPQISDEDIFQASRNVWSMNFMQVLLGHPVELTPAIFAYSMLYPYTDNYVDDPALSAGAKRAFNLRFRQRLEGHPVRMENNRERMICSLVAMIEDQFPRRTFPGVYASLLAIHTAQSRSLALLQPAASPYEMDVLGVCFEKGGTSVLADGYLIAGDLTPTQRQLAYYYGTFTQLVDDLEDAQSDRQAGVMTIFSQTAGRWPLDAITNRTFHYGRQFLEYLDSCSPSDTEDLKDAIRACINPLLIAAAGSNAHLYSRDYQRVLQAHFPYRFGFLEKQRKKLARRGVTAVALMAVLEPNISAPLGWQITHPVALDQA